MLEAVKQGAGSFTEERRRLEVTLRFGICLRLGAAAGCGSGVVITLSLLSNCHIQIARAHEPTREVCVCSPESEDTVSLDTFPLVLVVVTVANL